MEQLYKRIFFSFVLLFSTFFTTNVFAEGSKDFYPNTASGKRAFLVSATAYGGGVLSASSYPFLTQGTHYAYVKLNEFLSAASSAQNVGSGRIRLTAPDGTIYNSTNDNIGRIYQHAVNNPAAGLAAMATNRASELAGSRVGYAPFEKQVTTAAQVGIWKIEFIASGAGLALVDANATANWTQASDAGISAWDVSVFSDAVTTTANTGRVYANVFNLAVANSFGVNDGFYGLHYVLTKDGYAYRVNNNGMVGVAFTFLVNNNGFTSGAGGTGTKTYKSQNTSNPNVKDPRTADSGNGITHKIFYNKPDDNNLPPTASIYYASVDETWLKPTTIIPPTVTNITFEGVENSGSNVSNKGANIKFTSNVTGTYKIVIPGNGTFIDRVLVGECVVGANTIVWDGYGGLSVADPISKGLKVPPGTILNTVKIQLYGAEVHFPFVDVETNPKGIIIEQLTTDGNYTVLGGNGDLVYWDDTGIPVPGSATAPNPTKAVLGINTIHSNANGHKWGSQTTGSLNDYGNVNSIDTYTFVAGDEVTQNITATIEAADLEVTSNIPSITTTTAGNTITYTVVIKNLFTAGVSVSNVIGAKFGFEHPADFTITSAVLSTNIGTIVETLPVNGSTKWESTLSMTNGSQGTYVITGTVGAALKNTTLSTRATILRPADIADPNATDESTPAFSGNVDTECNGNPSGNGCNNIQPASVTITNNPPIGVPNVSSTNMNATLTVVDGATGSAGDLLVNDTDADGDVLTITKYTIGGIDYTSGTSHLIPGKGTITIQANGSYTFIPVSNFVGAVDQITYTLNDGTATATTTLDITVNATTNTLSGKVFNDTNGLLGTPANTVDGADYTAGNVNVVAWNTTDNRVEDIQVVSATGTYNLIVPSNKAYSLYVTTNNYTVGSTVMPTVALPTGWVNTGEHVGAGAGSDLTPNGVLAIGTINTNQTNLNFGIEQIPTAGSGANTVTNPGGTTQVAIPANTFSNITASSDPTPGAVTGIRITNFPSNTTSIVINGTTYTSANQAALNALFIPTNSSGEPTVSITFDPVGPSNSVINFVAIDAAGKESTTTGTATITVNNNLPVSNPVTAVSQSNPGGTVKVAVPTLTGTDTEDGTYNGTSLTNTIRIITLPTGGTLYYDNVAVTAGQTITNYDPAKLTLDPNNGVSNFSFTYSHVDSNNGVSTSATVSIPFTNSPPTTNNITNAIIPSNQATPVDISNPIGADVDGTVDQYKIVTLPTSGTLYLANGTTAVTAGQVLTVAEADGLKFKPSGTSNATVTFTIAAIDNQGLEDATPATFEIPISNTPPVSNPVIAVSQSNPGGVVKVTVPTLTGTDTEDGTYNGTSLTNTIRIITLPTGGTLYYDNVAVTAGQNIINYDPSKLTLDPNNGVSNVIFNYSHVDSNNGVATPAMVNIPFSNTPPITNNILNIPIPSNQSTPIDISNPTGADIDGTVEQYKIITLPTSGTLYLANGITAVVAGQVLTVAEANGLKFKPSGTSNTTVTFNLAAIDNENAQGITANFVIPLINTPPVSNAVTAVSQSNPGGTVKVAVPTLTGTDTEDGIYNGTSLTNTIRITTLPTGGTLYYDNVAVTAGQTITNYDPAKLTIDPNNGVSNVSFTYSHVDTDNGVSTSATVSIPFTNSPPTTNNITNLAIPSNQATPIDISNPIGADVDGTVDQYKIVTLPTSGTLYLANGTTAVTAGQVLTVTEANGLKFKPSGTSNATVTFTISAIDNQGLEDATPATFEIPLINTPPTTDNITNAAITSNQATPVDISNPTGADIDGTVTNYKITSLPTTGTLYKADGTTVINLNDILTVAEADGLKFKPAGNTNTTVTFTLAAIDNQGLEDATPATFSIPLSNTPPVAIANTVNTNEDTPVTLPAIHVNDTDNDGNVVSSTIDLDPATPGQQITFTDTKGTWTLTPATGNVLFTPIPNYNGTATINYTINDNDGATSNPASLTVVVAPVNDNPVANPDTNTVLEDQTLSVGPAGILTNDSDVDAGDQLTVIGYTIAGITGNKVPGVDYLIPNVGTINIIPDGRYTFRPEPDFFGPVPVITYTISDLSTGTTTSTLTLNVLPVNDAPSFTKGADQIIATSATPVAQTVTNWATALSKGPANESTQVLDFIVTNDKNTLFTTQPAIDANGNLTYTPAPNQFGKATVTVKIHDDGGVTNGGINESPTQTFVINIKPVGAPDADITPINTATTTNVIANDGASGVGTVVILGGTNPTNGSIVINPDKTITYTPNNGFVGTDTYTYILETADGVKSDPITVTITVYDPKMTLAKEGTYNDFNTNGKVDAGDRINYAFVVTNTGTIALTNITITDANATITGGPIASLAVGASDNTTFTGFHTLTQAEIDNGGVFNIAEAKGKDPKNNDVTTTSTDPTPVVPGDPNYPVTPPTPACPTCTVTPIVQTGAMTLAKEGTYNDFNTNGKVDAGDRINYTFVVTNTGNVTLTNVTITDANATISGGPIASLAVGASDNTTFTGFHTLTQAEIDNGGVFNIAEAKGKDPKNNDVTTTSTDPTPVVPGDPNYPVTPPTPACPTCTVTPIVQTGAMTLAKDGAYFDFNTDGKVNVGDRINYTFRVTNTGNVVLHNITISDADATILGGPIVTLAAGAFDATTFTGYHTLTQADIDRSGVYNLATVNGLDPKNKPITATSNDPTPLQPTDPGFPVLPPATPCATCTITPLLQVPSMRIAKEGTFVDSNADGIANIGDVINYTFTVYNTGNVTLSNIIITDNNAVMSGGPLATLAVGASNSTTFTAVHTLTQADIDNGGIFNVATGNAKDPKGNDLPPTKSDDPTPITPTDPNYPVTPPTPACPTCTVTPIVQLPKMTLAKDGAYFDFNADGKVNAGDRINYTFVVSNTGNVSLTNVAITDANATITGGPIASLAAGAVDNTTFTGYHTLTAAEIDNGGVFNVATATAKDPRGNDVTTPSNDPTPLAPTDPSYPIVTPPACANCTVTPVPQVGSFSLLKDGAYVDFNGDGKANIGDRINYTFRVTNTGNVTLKNITITDANAVVADGPIVSLAAGATDNTTFTAYHVLTAADFNNGGVFNVAIVKGTDPRGNEISTPSTDPTPVLPTDPSYPNNPPITPCATCTVTPLPQTPSMRIVKDGTYVDTNGDGVTNIGDRINYTFNVINTGNVAITNIVITDNNATVVGGPLATLAAGANDNTTFTAFHVLTQADIDNAGVFNVATGTGKDPRGNDLPPTKSDDPTPILPTDPNYPVTPPVTPCPTCTVTPIVQAPKMSLLKDGVYVDTNADGKINVGDRINYTFNVINTGNVTIKNIVITDANAVVTGGPIVSLAPGANNNTTFTAYHIITQGDIDNGGVFNVAIAKGKDPKNVDVTTTSTDPTPVAPTDPSYPVTPPTPACPTCTVTPIVQEGKLSLLKDGVYADTNADGKVNVGDRINYTFVVTNIGNVTLTNITVSDPNAVMIGGPIASLAVGAQNTTTFTGYHILTQADIDNGGVFNSATAKGKDPKNNDVTTTSTDPSPLAPGSPTYPVTPPTPACPTCTVTPAIQTPGITVTKDGAYADTNADGVVNIGDRINYTFVVNNTGNVTLTDVVITDPNATMVGGPIVTLAPGISNSTTFTAYHILTQADIDNRGVFNVATVTAKDPRGTTITRTSTDPTPLAPTSPLYPITSPVPACTTCTVTPIVQTGAIALVKTVTNTGTGINGAFVLGNPIQYTFTITNTGNVSLNNITLVDTKLGTGTINVAGTLLPGASTTVVRNYTITAADIAAGSVTNTATANATTPDGTAVNDVSGSTPTNNTPTVTGLGKPPVATNDNATTPQNSVIKISIQTNDVAGTSPIIVGSVVITVQPLHGTVVVNADGTVTYTPTPGYVGPDTFTYTVKDANGQTSNPAVVSINVMPSVPKAVDDNASTTFSKPVTIPIVANDTKDVAPFDLTSIEIVSQPPHGTVKINSDGTITYTPNDGYTGTETFTYRVKDAYGNFTNIATVTVLVEGLFFGNVITPDGDGKNDAWVIVGANAYDRIEVEFYNRWGNQVYISKNYKNDWNGERLNEGTYYYTVRLYKGSTYTTHKGWLLIKR